MKTLLSKEYRTLIERLIKACKEAGLTQQQVAKLIDRPQTYISKIETRERRIDVLELNSLAKIYGVEIQTLIN